MAAYRNAAEALHAVDPELVAELSTFLTGAVPLDGTVETGIDGSAPLTIVPAIRSDVMVVRFGLTNRRKFEGWLDSIDGSTRKRIQIRGESASVLMPESDRPITCLARRDHAFCQVGADHAEPVADLVRITTARGRTYGTLAGLAAAQRRLSSNGLLYGYANPAALAGALGTIIDHTYASRVRFGTSQERKSAAFEATSVKRELSRLARYTDGAAVVVVTEDQMSASAELSLTSLGSRLVRTMLPGRRGHDLLGRWAQTPALMSVLIHANPAFAQKLSASLQLGLPAKALTGSIAMLALGVDPHSPAALDPSARLDWAFLLPSAVMIGLAGKEQADRVHAGLTKNLTPMPERKVAWVATPRTAIAGNTPAGPFEVHVLDDMMVVGTGPGSAAAALRRLASIADGRAEDSTRFLTASISPRAIDAAFATAGFGRKHRRELLNIEAMRLRMKPLLERYEAVSLRADAHPNTKRVRVDLRLR